jgi:hypothetical protein
MRIVNFDMTPEYILLNNLKQKGIRPKKSTHKAQTISSYTIWLKEGKRYLIPSLIIMAYKLLWQGNCQKSH